ncbi:MAG: anti-sigma factor antagonist [Streptosporangiales bacterium]|nr:anti-sigma factor antagonist [Streptosporangiales bacterium]
MGGVHVPLTVGDPHYDADAVTVAIVGELDLGTVDLLEEATRPLVGSRRLVLDCAGLEFCDSTGLAALIRIAGRMGDAGGSINLVHVKAQIRRVIHLTGLTRHLGVV